MENYVGEIRSFAGEHVPEDWHLCDGSELTISDYPALFALIGYTYGGSEGQRKFRVPDLRSRIPLGETANYPLGKPGGSEKVALIADHLPKHKHPVACSTTSNVDLPNAVDGVWSASSAKGFLYNAVPGTIEMNIESIQAAGKGEGHENRVPVIAVTFIIALNGQFPGRS